MTSSSDLFRIFEIDFHDAKNANTVPLFQEVPILNTFLPVIVSSDTRGKFIVSRKMTKEGRVRVGIYDDISFDPSVIYSLFDKALELSVQEKFDNVFKFENINDAYNYLIDQSGLNILNGSILVPNNFNMSSNSDFVDYKYKNFTVYRSKLPYFVLLSKPDYVGLCTRFFGLRTSILLHNVKMGVAFCTKGV